MCNITSSQKLTIDEKPCLPKIVIFKFNKLKILGILTFYIIAATS